MAKGKRAPHKSRPGSGRTGRESRKGMEFLPRKPRGERTVGTAGERSKRRLPPSAKRGEGLEKRQSPRRNGPAARAPAPDPTLSPPAVPARAEADAAYTKVRMAEVKEGDVGMRLDRWFSREIPALAHGRLQKLLRTGQVRVNGARVGANARLEAGQTIRIPPIPGLSEKPAPEPRAPRVSDADARDLQARVLYRDDDVIALNKPAGLAVQGGTGTSRHLDGMLEELQFEASERPKLVHRLDRDTSGVLLLARSSRAAAALTRAFSGRGVEKTYWALVLGVPKPKQGTIDLALAKATGPTGREKMEESEEGDDAITDYRVRENMKRASWVELWPHTGRTHQLRAHMAAIGTPIIGDHKYGGPESKLPGISPKLHLHAAQIALRLPSGKQVTIAAPLPEHMAQTWALFGFEVPKSMRGD